MTNDDVFVNRAGASAVIEQGRWLLHFFGDDDVFGDDDLRLRHSPQQSFRQRVEVFEQREGVSGLLRNTQAFTGNDVHCQVDSGLTRTLQVEDDGILNSLILEPAVIRAKLLTNARIVAGSSARSARNARSTSLPSRARPSATEPKT